MRFYIIVWLRRPTAECLGVEYRRITSETDGIHEDVMELEDMADSKSVAERREGSSPSILIYIFS